MSKRNERLEGVFNRVAAEYNTIGPRYFSYFGEKLVEYSKIKEGSKILDIACGRGASLFPAIQSVGEKGQVVGIDFSQEMVRETQNLICNKTLRNAKVLQMDAEKLDFNENNFDYVLCGLAIAFFSDLLTSINEMYRVLAKGGKLGLTTWKKRESRGILDKVYGELFPTIQHTNLNNIVGRPDFGSVDGINAILKAADFKNIEIFVEEKCFYYKDEEEWWQEQWTNASRGLFEHIQKLGADTMERFKEVTFVELMKYKDENGIRFNADVLFSFGEK